MSESEIRDRNSELKDHLLPLPLPAMVESLLFVSSEPVPVGQLAQALDTPVEQVEEVLAVMKDGTGDRGLRLLRKGDRVQLTTRPECAPYVEKFLGLDLTSRLSKPALETLAIIAYQQPVTRAQIEQVRGVNCDGVLSTLLTKGLIEELGRLDTAGRPIQYGTSFAFLQYFGLRSVEDMPPPLSDESATLDAMTTGERVAGAAAQSPTQVMDASHAGEQPAVAGESVHVSEEQLPAEDASPDEPQQLPFMSE